MIPKPVDGERPLGIPTIRNRVVQTAVKRHAARRRRQPGQSVHENRLLEHRRLTGRAEALAAYIASYADDFVILNRGHAAEALVRTRRVTARLGLPLNEAKTSLRDACAERFDFLGYGVRSVPAAHGQQAVPGREPVEEERAAVQNKVGDMLVRRTKRPPAPDRSRSSPRRGGDLTATG